MNPVANINQSQTDTNLFEFLLSVPAFNRLNHDEIEMLEQIMRVDNYAHGHTFKTTDNIYLIIGGEVAISDKAMFDSVQHDYLMAGEIFGLFSLTDNSRQSASCTALGTVRAASLPRSVFELLFSSDLPLSLHFHHLIANQVSHQMHAVVGFSARY